MAVCVIAILPFIEEPAVGPNLGGSQHLLAGPQDDAHRLVVEYHRETCHRSLRCRAKPLPRRPSARCPDINVLRFFARRELSIRHVQRRVVLTRRLDRGEARALGATAAVDLPTAIEAL